VIETKKGNPLSLSIIYSVIAQSLDLPVYGINLPNHFVLGYLDENDLNGLFDKSDRSGVLFYINAFSKGGVFDKKEIASFLENIDRKNDRQYYEPCSNSAILSRMLLNLMSAYRKRRDEDKFAEIKRLRNLFDLKV
jgi:regulator of sirC expression with transglutaminase-like and TPR domain